MHNLITRPHSQMSTPATSPSPLKHGHTVRLKTCTTGYVSDSPPRSNNLNPRVVECGHTISNVSRFPQNLGSLLLRTGQVFLIVDEKPPFPQKVPYMPHAAPSLRYRCTFFFFKKIPSASWAIARFEAPRKACRVPKCRNSKICRVEATSYFTRET